MGNRKRGVATTAIHAGKFKDVMFGSLTTPIYQTSTFIFENCAQGGARFALEEDGFIYSRIGNPSGMVIEEKVAQLEGGEAAIVTGSGMGAITSLIWTIASAGKHIIADNTLYGCTYAFLSKDLVRFGVEVSFIDLNDTELLKATLKENTIAIFIETPANPNLKITDIEKVSTITHAYNASIQVICDNTFASPFNQKPLALGVDVVVHSATKYLNGHGDLIAGFIVGKKELMKEILFVGIKNMTGAVLAANECFLIERGLKTFEVRMQRHNESGMKIAHFLQQHPKVEKVYYPGLETHENYAIACKQMSGFGGVLAFEVQGGRKAGELMLNSMEMSALAVSVGSDECLIEHPASMTHSTYTEEELREVGIPAGLVRFSVGLENVEDIIADLELGLSKI